MNRDYINAAVEAVDEALMETEKIKARVSTIYDAMERDGYSPTESIAVVVRLVEASGFAVKMMYLLESFHQGGGNE